jgi:hypothetical protein
VADAVAFYEEQLAAVGGEVTSSIIDGIGLLTVRQGDHVISVSVTPVDEANNGVVITSVSMNPLVSPGDCAVSQPANSQSETVPDAPAVFCRISGNSTVNQRTGPGTNFDLAGELTAGTNADVNGQATGSDGFVWWRLGEAMWVRSDVVDEVGDCESMSIVQP